MFRVLLNDDIDYKLLKIRRIQRDYELYISREGYGKEWILVVSMYYPEFVLNN
jgi:hypothetical protein